MEISASALNEKDLETSQEPSPNLQETIVIDESCETEYTCDLCGFSTTVKHDLQTHMITMHEVQCGICKTKFKNLDDLSVHEKEDHSEEEETDNESSVVHHLRKKCVYLEEEIVKERKINAANLELVNNQKKNIEALKKEIEKANDRTKIENGKVVETNEELTKLKDKINAEIIANENHRKVIEELNMKIHSFEETQSTNEDGSSRKNVESEEMKTLKEKAKEFKATCDIKITKLKEKHLEEVTEIKIRKLRVEEELRSVV